MPVVLPGALHPKNGKVLCWNEKGLLLYGNHCAVVVVDLMRCKIIQILEKHTSVIAHISCSPGGEMVFSSENHWRCASADTSGFIVIWDIIEGAEISSFSSAECAPLQIMWLPWDDTNCDFLLVLHAPNNLTLWNTATGLQIWRVTYAQALTTFAVDPFDPRNVTFAVIDGSLLTVENILVHKAPLGRGSCLQVFGTVAVQLPIQIEYHNAFANILFAAAKNEIVCIEMECRCILWRHKTEADLLKIFSCSERDMIFTVDVAGMIAVWACRIIKDEKDNSALIYEALFRGETQRQSAQHRIFAAALCPVTQSTVALLYNSGSVSLYQLGTEDDSIVMPYRSRFITDLINVDSLQCIAVGSLKLSNIIHLYSLGQGATTVRMCPVNAEKSHQLVAVGSNQGSVRLINLIKGTVFREFLVHTCPIKCLDWGGPYTLVSAAYVHPLSTTSTVKNDIFITDVRTGESRRLRPEVEETPVELLRVSFYHCYIAIGFRCEPLEIWHLKSMRLLRRMSRTCPVIIDMAWSGKHHAAKKIVEGSDPVFRENLVVLDEECHLYHVVVKGLHVRDGKEVNSQWKTGAAVKCLVWKDDLLAMGDAWGRLGVWDLGKRQCRQTRGSSRGPILKLVFSRVPEDHTLSVLHQSSVALWDSDQLTLLQQYAFGGTLSFVDIDLCDTGSIVICSDSSLRCINFNSSAMPSDQRETPLLFEIDSAELLSSTAVREEKYSALLELLCLSPSDGNFELAKDNNVRIRAVHRLFGDRWLYDLWSVVCSSLGDIQLSSRLFMFWDSADLKRRVEHIVSCLMSLSELNSAQVDLLVHQAVVLQKIEWAMQLLLGTRNECRTSAFRACLLASDVTSEGAQSVIKLVATNLIANNCMTDGVQMLFLIGHGDDACRYLQAHGFWSKSFQFAKLGLSDWKDVGIKWLDYLIATKAQKMLSCLLAANVADWDRLITLLVQNSKANVAHCLLEALNAQSVSVAATTAELVTEKPN